MRRPFFRSRRHALGMVYVTVTMTAMFAFCSLAVDLGRAQVAKTQLTRATDAAARYGACGIPTLSQVSWAKAVFAQNIADGNAAVLQSADVSLGVWSPITHTFTATSVGPNAVRVSPSLTVPTVFAMVIGRSSVTVHASSIAMITLATNTTINVPGGSNPWLAGMPSGTTANYTNQGWVDQAPANSPVQASGITLTQGNSIQFNFTGAVSYYPGTQPFDPDGDPSWIIDNYYATAHSNAEHGIANLKAPLTSVIGVFLDASQPDSTAAPAMLDFTSASSRDFASISPLLKQPFYIGNGVRADMVTLQNFVVPTGATRLYIGVMDGQQWSDNSGSLSTHVVRPLQIQTVK